MFHDRHAGNPVRQSRAQNHRLVGGKCFFTPFYGQPAKTHVVEDFGLVLVKADAMKDIDNICELGHLTPPETWRIF